MDPRLSQYTQFFVVVTQLSNKQQITEEQKLKLKARIMSKDQQLLQLIAQYSKEEEQQWKQNIIEYAQRMDVATHPNHLKNMDKSKHIRISVSARQIQPCINQIAKTDEPINCLNSNAYVIMDQLTAMLKSHCEKKGLFSYGDQERLKDFRNLLNFALDEKVDIEMEQEHEFPRPRNTSVTSRFCDTDKHSDISETSLQVKQQFNQKIIGQIRDVYKQLKQVFMGNMNTHLLLMKQEISSENLFNVVKSMIKTLVDADGITFFIRRQDQWELYSTEEDTLHNITKEQDAQFAQHFDHLKPNHIYTFQSQDKESYFLHQVLPKVVVKKQTSMIRFVTENTGQEVLFMFQWLKNYPDKLQRKFINQANEYGFVQDVINLSNFLIDIITQARVQYFNPLLFSDQIQDLSLQFVGISRYILVDGIKQALELHYKVIKEQAFSEDEFGKIQNEQHVTVEMKCRNPVTLIIQDMNLQQEKEKDIYTEIIKIQEKYERHMRLCYEKSAYYKYFVRSSDSLVFDFDKSGRLLFLSHPIWQSLQQRYNIQYNPNWNSPTYLEIFLDEKITQFIEIEAFKLNKKNQYIQHEDFEIFLKIVDQVYQGFAIIFHLQENQRIKDCMKSLTDHSVLENEIKQTIQRSVNQHQTFKFIAQLEQSNPGMKNSMISLFLPENQSMTQIDQTSGVPRRSRNNSIGSSLIKPFNYNFTIQSIEEDESSEYEIDSNSDLSINRIDFNILAYNCKDKLGVVFKIFKENDWIQMYQINTKILKAFLIEIQRKYNKRHNPFHNFDHGLAVMQSCHILTRLEPATAILSEITHFSTVISGLCHDVSHFGRANLFEINSRSKLAIRYHEKSPLENYHAATTLKVLNKAKFNILTDLDKEDLQQFRQVLIDNILNTDIKNHFALLKDFENRCCESVGSESQAYGAVEGDCKLLTGMIIHSADFNGGAKTFEVSKLWTQRVNEEFKAQYIQEADLGIPQSPFLKDLDKIDVMAKSEMNFFKVIVRPLWNSLNQFFGKQLQEAVDNIDNTIISWDKIYHENTNV